MSEPALKQGKTSSNTNNQLPSVYESDDSELEDFLDDILERGRNALKKSSKAVPPISASSCAIDSRLEIGVEANAEMTLRRLVSLNAHSLMTNVNVSVGNTEGEREIPSWQPALLAPWQIDQQLSRTNRSMLISCFNVLFKDLQMQTPLHLEHTLQLWLTLNCNQGDEKFDPASTPFISLDHDSVTSLISAISWSSGLSLRAWCSVLQSLSLVCNIMQQGPGPASSQWQEPVGTYSLTLTVINHPDFVQMLLRLLSGTGLVFSEKGLVSNL